MTIPMQWVAGLGRVIVISLCCALVTDVWSATTALAQDVMVLPPEASGQPSLYVNDNPATVSDTSELPSAAAIPPAPQLAREEAIAQTASVGTADFMQCATNDECVLVNGGCTTLSSINKNYVQSWRVKQPPHEADCKSGSTQERIQSTLAAVCHDKLCGIQPKQRLK